jgi:small subunit ribosomal protein S6
MAKDPTLYDLVLLLSASAESQAREQVLADVETSISAAGGSIELRQDWGRRPTTFPINHQSEAEYHLIQFTGPTAVLETLEHNLRIADAVLRHRIIKVTPGTPPAPEGAPPVLAGAGAGGLGGDTDVPER